MMSYNHFMSIEATRILNSMGGDMSILLAYAYLDVGGMPD